MPGHRCLVFSAVQSHLIEFIWWCLKQMVFVYLSFCSYNVTVVCLLHYCIHDGVMNYDIGAVGLRRFQ